MSFNSGHIGNSTWNPTAIMLNLFYDSEKYVSLRIVTLCWSIHFVSAESWDQFNNLQKSHYDWFSAEKWVTPYCRHIMCSKKVIRSYNHSLINLLFYLFEAHLKGHSHQSPLLLSGHIFIVDRVALLEGDYGIVIGKNTQ
jgi:hypothetical protein